MTREAWIETHNLVKIEYGTRPATCTLVFTDPVARDEFMQTMCNGHELRGGGIRHDTEKRCLVHGTEHDGFALERLEQYRQ